MPTLYQRTFNLKPSLSDAEVLAHWRLVLDEVIPAILAVPGSRSCKMFSGAGALRAGLTLLWEMDDAGVYEKALHDASIRKLLGRLYGGWDLTSATQTFHREITPELIKVLTSTG